MLGVLCVLACAGACAQDRPDGPVSPPPRNILRHSISITGGAARPVTGDGLTRFWDTGPSGAVAFHLAVTRHLALGIALEAAQFRFDAAAFRSAFPAVEPQIRHVLWMHVGVGARISLLPGMRTSPFLTGTVGVARMTEALHRIIVNRERTTYYAVGGNTRLTLAAGAGVNMYFHRSLALELEGRGAFIHNDPDLRLALSARGGMRFLF